MQLRLFIQGLIVVRGSLSAFVHRHQTSFATTRKDTYFTTSRFFTTTHKQLQRNMSTDTNIEESTFSMAELLFGKFRISPSQIFYKSPSGLTAAIVNLRPIVPGHVLVIPTRVVRTLSQLTDEEYDDLWRSVRKIQNALEKHYNAGGFNVAVQDGRVAGQSVPHVHVHILPRKAGDFEQTDDSTMIGLQRNP